MRHPSKRALKYTGIFALVIFIISIFVIGAFFLRQAYLFAHAGDFQMFEPRKLPLGLKITERSLEISHERWMYSGYSPIFRNAGVSFDLGPLRGYISESADEDHIDPSEYRCTEAEGVKCRIAKTPKGVVYILSSAVDDYGSPWYQEVGFVKGSTNITVYIEDSSKKLISEKEWSEVIDSFVPQKFSNLKVVHRAPGP
jgi:hypothetical protein